MNTKKTEPRSVISIPMLMGALMTVTVVMCTVFVVSTLNKSQNTQRIAVVDITVLTQRMTLDLARSDLSESEIKTAVRERSEALEKNLTQLAEEYNLAILPAEIGVWGAKNITPLLAKRLHNNGGGQ